MKKFFAAMTLLIAIVVVNGTALAEDVPDIRNIAPNNIVAGFESPADANSAGCYEYLCSDGNADIYIEQYIQLLTDSGFEIVGVGQRVDYKVWGLVIPGKDVPAYEFYTVPLVHVLVEGGNEEIQIRLAPGITYG